MAAFIRRQFSGASRNTTTTTLLGVAGTSVDIAATTGWPSIAGVPFYVVINPSSIYEEKCLATISGSTLTLVRAQDDTTASEHPIGSVIYPVFTANDADEANELVSKLTTKGDLLVTDGSSLHRLGVGTNGFFLKANSSASVGVEWASIPTINNLNDIGDVTINDVEEGDFLVYKNSASAWINETIHFITVSDTEPTDEIRVGDLWYNSSELELYTYYSGSWIQVTLAPEFPKVEELDNVYISTANTGDVLAFDGLDWYNDTVSNLLGSHIIALSGDVSGSVMFDGSASVNISATIQPNSVALGTDTTGNYVNDVTAGTGVTVTHTPSEGSSPTIAIGQAVGTSSSVQFAHISAPLTGNVTGNVTGSSGSTTGNAATATALQNTRTISLGGDLSGSASFNGTADITISASVVNSGVSLDEISDVVITSVQNGQLLGFDGTNWVNTTLPTSEPIGHENKADSVISFTEGTRTFSISPASTSYTVWCKGIRYVKTGTSTVTIPNTSGIYYIYFNSSGVLSYKTSYFDFENDSPTAYVYWNATNSKAYFFADERHGIVLDWATHEYLHRTRGAAIANGFGINNYTTTGDGSSDAHAKFDIADGTFFDEDLEVSITHSETPTANTWEQTLQGNAEIPVFYRSGVGGVWVKDAATEFAFKTGATPRPTYNLNTAGTWTTPQVTDSYFTISWIIATHNLNEPVIAIMGQANYSSLGNAEAATWDQLDLTGLPIYEFRPLHKVIYRGYNIYTNSVNARIHNVTDIRQTLSTAGAVPSTPVSDHGSLTGLADDDHPQYLLADGTRVASSFEVTNNLVVGGNLTVNGTTTTLNTETLTVDDNIIILNNNATGAPSQNAGIEVERGSSTNVALRWNESSDKWETTNDGSTYSVIATNGNIALGTDTTGNSDNVTEGTTNLYFTDGRARTALLADNAGTASGIRFIAPNTGTVELISQEATRFVRVTSNAAVGGGKTEIQGSAQILASSSISDPGHLTVAGSITVGGGVVFEGDTANDYETTLVATDPTADRTITLPNADGTVALNGSIALGTDTTGNYMSDLTQGTGVTITHTPSEGSNATIAIGQDVSTSSSVTFANVTATGNVAISGRIDKTTIRESVADTSVSASVVTADYSTGDIFYVGTAPASNFTVNLTNAPTDNGKAITVVIFVTQGATGYIPNAVQVAGSAQTIKWANGTAPTPTSSAGKIDIFSFTFVRRSSAWTVFGSSNLGY